MNPTSFSVTMEGICLEVSQSDWSNVIFGRPACRKDLLLVIQYSDEERRTTLVVSLSEKPRTGELAEKVGQRVGEAPGDVDEAASASGWRSVGGIRWHQAKRQNCSSCFPFTFISLRAGTFYGDTCRCSL